MTTAPTDGVQAATVTPAQRRRLNSPAPSADGLAVGFYHSSCPETEKMIVRSVVQKGVQQNPGIGAGLFHDCFVQVCIAFLSVLYTRTSTVLDRVCKTVWVLFI